MAGEVGTLEMDQGVEEVINFILNEAAPEFKEIMSGIARIIGDLLRDSLGLIVDALNAAVTFLKNAFTHLIQNLINLGNTIRDIVNRHRNADRDGSSKLKAAGGS